MLGLERACLARATAPEPRSWQRKTRTGELPPGWISGETVL